ncbi:spore germination protein [Bacillus sp. AFS076308]|uniref:spore germination protein n=1 Tax=unclassified Bacillus (in: firmicutes) TaxID=185979 RepID=UPI000BF5FE48|nr:MULTISPECIES: spore germination protein [unclassified Bacillus (in: firmicutes)]PFN83634.1 spore germination protein [Bacillus sp. AFS076308]PGV48625.1 spore germination protein [Bacillus sp. AFS037270]
MNSAWSRLIKRKKREQKLYYEETELALNNQIISQDLDDNLKNIKKVLGNSSDLIIREFNMGKLSMNKVALLYINGLTDKEILGNFIIERLMGDGNHMESGDSQQPGQLFTYIKENILTIAGVEDVTDWNKILSSLLSGRTILLIDGWDRSIACSAQGGELRAISEPTTEPAVRGPKESFVESLVTNTAMVRHRIKSPNLWVETIKLGKVAQTDVSIMFLKGIVNEKLLTEVKERLGKIEVDEIAGSNTIEEWINDNIWTPWPTIFTTERPDVVVGNLLEGRVAIFVDGSPFPLILPATWIQFFQTAEDYYMNWYIASFLRLLRLSAFLTTLLGPSLFIAFISFHPELIPTPLLVSLSAQRHGIPFPVFIEALLMEFTFEVLREAGVRMPRPIGQAVSIVGALVLGQAAVAAGIVSSAMVIVVAGTAIASFTMPHASMTDATRLLRFIIMLLAASFGLYGIGLGVIVLVAHTCSVRSFGIPYLTPYAPLILADWKDTIIRFPSQFRSNRPRLLNQTNIKRTGATKDLGPSPREGQIKDHESKRNSNET